MLDVCRGSFAASPCWWLMVVFIVSDAVFAVKRWKVVTDSSSLLMTEWNMAAWLFEGCFSTKSLMVAPPTSRAPFSLFGRSYKSFHFRDIGKRFINILLDEKDSYLAQSICVTTEMYNVSDLQGTLKVPLLCSSSSTMYISQWWYSRALLPYYYHFHSSSFHISTHLMWSDRAAQAHWGPP